MRLRSEGIVVDHYGQVLVTKRGAARPWALPGEDLQPGELPPEAVARQVQEETGLKVMPVRLVGVYYEPHSAAERLTFSFRCLVEGGRLAEPDESRQLGYAATNPLPRPMLSQQRQRLADGLAHAGGPPFWMTQPASTWYRIVREALGQLLAPSRGHDRPDPGRPIGFAAGGWQAGAFVVIQNSAGEVLWSRRRDRDAWNLPGGGREPGEAPWQTAVRETREETGLEVTLTDLSGVYVKPAENEVVLVFTAWPVPGRLATGPETAELAYFGAGAEPANTLPLHPIRVKDALAARDSTFFRIQQKPAD